jgi:hypothetical protein
MSIPHLKNAFDCREFTGTTRLLLIALADSASNGQSVNKRNLPTGYSSLSLLGMMRRCNTNRSQTISAALKELREAGAIKTVRRKRRSSLTFVDIVWLRDHAYTESAQSKREKANPHLDAKRTVEATSTPVNTCPTPVSTCSTPVADNAKRTVKATQSAQSRVSSTTESVVKAQRKAHSNPALSRSATLKDQNHPAPQAVLIPPLCGEGAASLREKTKTAKPTPPKLPDPVPLTPDETCAECGGCWLDCPPSHKSGTVAKPVSKPFSVEETT